MLHDLRYAIRGLRNSPGFAAIVALSIALGIAANATVFSIVNGMLFGALPVRDPGGLYVINGGRTTSYPEYRDFRDQCAGVFDGLAGHFPLAPANIAGGGAPERIWGSLVTGNYFQVVGPPVALGRGVSPAEDQVPGRDPVVVLSHSLWTRRFAADPEAIGRPVLLNGRRYTVIGVMAPGFQGTDRGFIAEFWAPLAMRMDFVPDIAKDVESRNSSWMVISGRLKPGVTPRQAAAAVNVVGARSHDRYRKQEPWKALTVDQAGGLPGDLGGIRPLLTALMVVVGLVLLVACANVANLMLARAVERRKEIGIRLAMGAGRGRLIRQLLTESVALALIGAAGGFALAFAAARALSGFRLPLPLPFALDFTPDARVLAFTAALAIAAGIVAGVAPAFAATRADVASAVKETAAPGGFRRFGMRNLLVGVQVTLSAVLLIAGGLFIRSLGRVASIDLGIRPENVAMMTVDPKAAGYSQERFREFLRQLEMRAGALPGVRSAAASNILPLSFSSNTDGFSETSGGQSKSADADTFSVTPRYFETMGIPLLRGRNFNPETDLRQPTIVVSQIMARRMFGDGEAIGRTITGGGRTYQIIGIAGDSKSVSLGESVKACAYIYLPRDPEKDVISMLGLTILVKTTGNPAAMIRPIEEEIRKIDPALAVFGAETMEAHVDKAFLIPRICATLFGVFGLLGLALASVGLYGVASYSVRSRTREIGIRMALGARPGTILRLVGRQGMAIVIAGLALGLAASWGLSRFTASMLYGVSSTDAITFVTVPLVLLATAVIAVVVPARRAARLDPTKALRSE
jgi:predicted permease